MKFFQRKQLKLKLVFKDIDARYFFELFADSNWIRISFWKRKIKILHEQFLEEFSGCKS